MSSRFTLAGIHFSTQATAQCGMIDAILYLLSWTSFNIRDGNFPDAAICETRTCS